jgi:hypothetical protein
MHRVIDPLERKITLVIAKASPAGNLLAVVVTTVLLPKKLPHEYLLRLNP